jgi:hypothetical protein
MTVYGFNRNDFTPSDPVDPDDLVECPGFQSAVVDYVGDGTNNRLIDVGFAAKFYVIFKLEEGAVTDVRTYHNSEGWTFTHGVGAPYPAPYSWVEGTGINVGKIYDYFLEANKNGVAYRIIAYG